MTKAFASKIELQTRALVVIILSSAILFYSTIAYSNATNEDSKTTPQVVIWDQSEKAIIQSLSLNYLEKPELNPSNPFGNNSDAKVLGALLFNDLNLSRNKNFACVSCHKPSLHFSDGLEKAQGIKVLHRNTPTLLAAAYQTWFYADGRRDSLWAQAITPIEARDEMGGTRVAAVRYILNQPNYLALYQKVFGKPKLTFKSLPKSAGPYGNKLEKKTWRYLSKDIKHKVNQIFANIGRALASHQRDFLPTPGKLEKFTDEMIKGEVSVELSLAEQRGLKLFVNNEKTRCLQCHNGPLMTNGEFHNIGTASLTGERLDLGRTIGLQAVFRDEFNCYGLYSNVTTEQCDALRFVNQKDSHSPLLGAYKVPTLRGISLTAPYGHDGRFKDLKEILEHYRSPPDASKQNHELQELDLTDKELNDLASFLNIL